MKDFSKYSRGDMENIADMLLGPKLGEGYSRAVYCHRHNPDLVVKIALPKNLYNGVRSNMTEYQLWDSVCWRHDTGVWFKDWLAPVEDISEDGQILIMRRTQPITKTQLPPVVPVWLSDMQLGNWGILDGRPVMHDYGNNLVMEHGLVPKMKVLRSAYL